MSLQRDYHNQYNAHAAGLVVYAMPAFDRFIGSGQTGADGLGQPSTDPSNRLLSGRVAASHWGSHRVPRAGGLPTYQRCIWSLPRMGSSIWRHLLVCVTSRLCSPIFASCRTLVAEASLCCNIMRVANASILLQQFVGGGRGLVHHASDDDVLNLP